MKVKGFKIVNGMAVPEEETIIYKKNKAFRNIGIPSEYWDMTIDNFVINQDSAGNELTLEEKAQKSKVKEIANEYANALSRIISERTPLTVESSTGRQLSSQNLIFKGDGGSGKTLLAVVILKAALEQTTDVVFSSWNDFHNTLSDFENKAEAEYIEERFMTAQLAIIDGITSHAYKNNIFFQRKMECICGHRLGNQKPMIWTSYINGHDICQMFGPSTQSFVKNAIILKLPNGIARDSFKEI